MRYPFIAGNWKMYKTTAEARAFARELKKIYQSSDVKVAIFAPFTQLAALAEEFKGTGICLGAQNVHYEREGAFTGEISVPMLREIGVEYCIVGHSERRQYFNESDETVNRKAKALLEAGITPHSEPGNAVAVGNGAISIHRLAQAVQLTFPGEMELFDPATGKRIGQGKTFKIDCPLRESRLLCYRPLKKTNP